MPSPPRHLITPLVCDRKKEMPSPPRHLITPLVCLEIGVCPFISLTCNFYLYCPYHCLVS
jgi:hypothetical protein